MATWPFTDDPLAQTNLLYVGYFGRAGDPGGANFWVGELLDGLSLQAAAASFSVQEEAKDKYPLLANPLINSPANISAFLDEVYANLFARAPDAGGKAYWAAYIQDAIDTQDPIIIANAIGQAILLISFGALGTDQTVLSNKVTAADYVTDEFAAAGIDFTTPLPPGTPENDANNVAFLFSTEAVHSVNLGGQSLATSQLATDTFVDTPPSGRTFALTLDQDEFHGTGRDLFNAFLKDGHATLTHFDNITSEGSSLAFGVGNPPFAPGFSQLNGYGPALPPDSNTSELEVHGAFFGSVLNASFNAVDNAENYYSKTAVNYVSGVNIEGIQTWNINAIEPIFDQKHSGWIVITAGSGPAQNVISGLEYLNFNANSGNSSLLVGDNTEPVQTLVKTITVSNAVGTGKNGVDVDIRAQAFTGNNTINIVGNVVGGFPLEFLSTSLIIPDPIVCDRDYKDGGWGDGSMTAEQTFSDGSGGSGDGWHHKDSDSLCVNWQGFFDNAYAIAAGASSGPTPDGWEGPDTGAVSYTNWNVYSIGAWQVEPKIEFGNWLLQDATGQKGGVNIMALGAEGSWSPETLTLHDDGSSTILFSTDISDSNGSEDWQNLTNINLSDTSGFVVLSGAELGDLRHSKWNNNKFWSHYSSGLLSNVGTVAGIAITIQGGAGNSFYDLTSFIPEVMSISSIDGGHGTNGNSEIAINNYVATTNFTTALDLTNIQVLDVAAKHQGGTIFMSDFPLGPLNVDYTLLGGGTVDADDWDAPLLQFLGADGCTGTKLTEDLVIRDAPFQFAINMQDMADDGYNITVQSLSPPLADSEARLDIWISDGCCPLDCGIRADEVAALELDGEDGYSCVYNVPVFAVTNYSTVNIHMPFEGEYIGLGTNLFIVSPVLHFDDPDGPVVEVNFYDNEDDTGCDYKGSPDNLYLGHTQTYDEYFDPDNENGLHYLYEPGTCADDCDDFSQNAYQLIGQATVIIDTLVPPDQEAHINFYGHGFFEIGATDATHLNALNSSHLVMDLPGTGGYGNPAPFGGAINHGFEWQELRHGIEVTGSEHGASLLQGTSGPIQLSYAADHFPNGFVDDPILDEGAEFDPECFFNDAYWGAVGNDVIYANAKGDNVFGIGGDDHIYLNAEGQQTVWIGAYDIGHTGFSFIEPKWGEDGKQIQDYCQGYEPGLILEQAITDYNPNSGAPNGHVFVNGYGDTVTTVSGFEVGDGGDTVNFLISSWFTRIDEVRVDEDGEGAELALDDSNGWDLHGVLGLTTWDGQTKECCGGETPKDLVFWTIEGSGEQVGSNVGGQIDVVLYDTGSAFDNAAQVLNAITTLTGFFFLDGTNFGTEDGVLQGNTVDMLFAYRTTDGGITIADLTIYAETGDVRSTNDADGVFSVTDLVHLEDVPQGLATLTDENIQLLCGCRQEIQPGVFELI